MEIIEEIFGLLGRIHSDENPFWSFYVQINPLLEIKFGAEYDCPYFELGFGVKDNNNPVYQNGDDLSQSQLEYLKQQLKQYVHGRHHYNRVS